MSIGISYDKWKNKTFDEIPPVVYACGPESTLKEDWLDQLQHSFPGDDREVVSMFADEASPEEVMQELDGQGLFNSRKWIVLKGLEKSGSGGNHELSRYFDALKKYITGNSSSQNKLILLDADHPYESGRKTGSLGNTIEDNDGWVIVFWEPFDDALRAKVRKSFDKHDMRIQPDALQKLLEKTNGKYGRIQGEIEKLIEIDKPQVTVDDISEVVARVAEDDDINSLEENLIGGTISEVLRQLDDRWRRGDREYQLFHMVFRFFFRLKNIRVRENRDNDLESALEETGLPPRKKIKKHFRRALKTINSRYPGNFYRKAYETGKKTKYEDSDFRKLALEFFLLRFSQDLRPR